MTPHTADDLRAKQYDVLVSYKREDDDQRQELVEALEARGYQVFWDGKLGPDYWRVEWRNRLLQSKLMIVLWSATAAQSDEVKDEAGGAKAHEKCLSVPLDGEKHVPKPFRETNGHHWDRNADEATRQAQLEKVLDKVAQIVGPPRRAVAPPPPDAVLVEFGEIPGAPDKLIGRDAELAMLRDAWASRPPRKVNTVVLHALGGAGKSALLRTFANELLAGGGGAARVYGWSAYSQGSGEQKRADADGFISKALADFGFEGELPGDPVERARALARLIQKERVLLLLDGLEPLQDPPGVNKGRFKDKGLAELIKLLAGQNPGLVVLTTRQEVPELAGYGPLVINHALEELSERAGADLLVELGVRGRQRELEAAVHEVQGHALSVTLLGTYLAEVRGGDIRNRDQFDFADIVLSPEEQSELATDKTIIPAKRAAKVMRGYLEQFEKLAKDGATAGLGGPERVLLNLLGLFDRPADGPAVEALLAQHIPGLTDELFFDNIETTSGWIFKSQQMVLKPIPETKRKARLREAKSRLRKLRLLSRANPKDPHELDAHPVVRAFFAGRLDDMAPEAAGRAHLILYRHYSAAAPDLPDTLEAMQPLFHAIKHGVKGGQAQEAYDDVLRRRMCRDQPYIGYRIGSFQPDLTAVAAFFTKLWTAPDVHLDPGTQRGLLREAHVLLVFTGRLHDSLQPLDCYIEQKAEGSVSSQLISALIDKAECLLLLGRVRESENIIDDVIGRLREYASEERLFDAIAVKASILVIQGSMGDAKKYFDEYVSWSERRDDNQAVSIRAALGERVEIWSVFLIIDVPGALDYVLNNFDHERLFHVFAPFLEGLERSGTNSSFVGIVELLIALGVNENESASLIYLDNAVARLRDAKVEVVFLIALLARAARRRRRAAAGEVKLIEGIRADLAEVEDIAGEEMRLYLADLALQRACLALDVPSAFASPEAAGAEAAVQTAKAAQLIADTSYHLRDPELAELQARLAAAR